MDFWLFTVFWVIGGALEAFSNQSCMLLWMKTTGNFSVPENNDYPLGVTAIGRIIHTIDAGLQAVLTDFIGIVCTLVTSVAIDATHVHMPYGIAICGLQIISCIILLCWNSISIGAKMAAYCKLQEFRK